MITLQKFPDGEEWNSRIVIAWFYRLVSAFNKLTETGTTAERPNPAPFVGFMHWDTTLQIPVYATNIGPPVVWKDSAGNVV
jgi:hypothetical protein